ncbi:MAG TPA: glycosyltransferase [Candidatus Saccharimonadales bacterium]|nr:glycosyltransferase [Candidatus Saccharimonadales bacterium]
MKIFFYSDSSYYSGAEKILDELSIGLGKNSPGSQLVLNPKIRPSLEASGFNARSSNLEVSYLADQSKLNIFKAGQLTRMIKRTGASVVVANMWSPYANTAAILSAGRARVPLVLIFHYFEQKRDVSGWLRPIKLWAYRFAFKRADRIVTVSQAHRKILIDQFGCPDEKVLVIHNGITGPDKTISRTFDKPRKFLMVGTLEANKGQRAVIERLKNLNRDDWTLTLVGSGPLEEPLRAFCRAENLSDKITFLGRQDNLKDIYSSHDVLINNSDKENLSVAIMEAMSFGLPVIASNVGGNRELVDDQNGWLVGSNDEDGWRAALSEAIDSTAGLEKKSPVAYSRWHSQFNQDKMIISYQKLLEEI